MSLTNEHYIKCACEYWSLEVNVYNMILLPDNKCLIFSSRVSIKQQQKIGLGKLREELKF